MSLSFEFELLGLLMFVGVLILFFFGYLVVFFLGGVVIIFGLIGIGLGVFDFIFFIVMF